MKNIIGYILVDEEAWGLRGLLVGLIVGFLVWSQTGIWEVGLCWGGFFGVGIAVVS